jgi:hypothetical protein
MNRQVVKTPDALVGRNRLTAEVTAQGASWLRGDMDDLSVPRRLHFHLRRLVLVEPAGVVKPLALPHRVSQHSLRHWPCSVVPLRAEDRLNHARHSQPRVPHAGVRPERGVWHTSGEHSNRAAGSILAGGVNRYFAAAQ